MSNRLELVLRPDWDLIKGTWDRCRDHFAQNGLDEDTAYALSMVCQELLENGVKYGTFVAGRETIELRIEVAKALVTVEVRTPLGQDDARLKQLDEMIQWIRGFQNPFEAYVERLKQVSSQPFASHESGLGLVRIAYEGHCLLDFYVDSTNHLAMSAVFQPGGGSHQRDHGNAHL